MLELPALEQFAREAAPKGVRLMSINVKGMPATVRRLAVRYDLPVLLDVTGAVADRYDAERQPYNVVITGSRVSARFSGPTSHVTLLDALRAATKTTGKPVMAEAGMDPRRTNADLVRRNGDWFDGGRQVAKWNQGRWTTEPDGVYVDPASGHILAVATVRGRPAEAFTLAEVHGRLALLVAAEAFCQTPPSRSASARPPADVRADDPACLCSSWEVFAHVHRGSKLVRVALFPVSPIVRRAAAFLVGRQNNGTVTFSLPPVPPRDLTPSLRDTLLAEGRVLPNPLEPSPLP